MLMAMVITMMMTMMMTMMRDESEGEVPTDGNEQGGFIYIPGKSPLSRASSI